MNNSMTPLKEKRKLITGIVIVALLFIAVLTVFLIGYRNAKEKYTAEIQSLKSEVESLSDPIAAYDEASREVDITLMNSDIQNIGELATIEYLYTNAGKFEDPAELFGQTIPLTITTKSFIAKWDGVIKAGIDISQVSAEKNEDTKEIIIYIPQAKILSHEIDGDSIETLNQKNGLFNPVKVEDVRDFDEICKEAMEERAIENGILDKAFENAELLIKGIVDTGNVKEQGYTVVFKVIE